MKCSKGTTSLRYQVHYAVDGGKARIILGVLVTPSEVTENRPMLDLLWRARFRWRLLGLRHRGRQVWHSRERCKYREGGHSSVCGVAPVWRET